MGHPVSIHFDGVGDSRPAGHSPPIPPRQKTSLFKIFSFLLVWLLSHFPSHFSSLQSTTRLPISTHWIGPDRIHKPQKRKKRRRRRNRQRQRHGGIAAAAGSAIPAIEQDLRGLLAEEPAVGVRLLRRLHVPGVLGQAPRPRGPHLLRPIRDHGLLVRNPDQEDGGRRQRRPQRLPLAVRNPQGNRHRHQVQHQRRQNLPRPHPGPRRGPPLARSPRRQGKPPLNGIQGEAAARA